MELTIDEVKRRLKPVFQKAALVRQVVLFGSIARGDASRGSDVDLVVDTGGEILGLPFYELLYDVTEVLPDTRVEMFETCEIVPNSPIARNIENEGIVIYE
ncbi:MAG: nucleotidyltransferase domain-containing protein [Synergistaceae bacterium]|nr:nucleotidyltransferase domain-containing protein [Synergistaceae bacterium]